MHRLKRAIMPGVLILAAYYALFGGEYSIFELHRARLDVLEQEADLAQLHQRIDSLRSWADSLESDPATLERIARERFGLIREGETLYRFAGPADSGYVDDSTEVRLR